MKLGDRSMNMRWHDVGKMLKQTVTSDTIIKQNPATIGISHGCTSDIFPNLVTLDRNWCMFQTPVLLAVDNHLYITEAAQPSI